MKRSLLVVSVVVLLATMLYGTASLTAADHPLVGKPAPDFTLTDIDGKPVRLADLRGKAVVLNFWATWCPPCRFETPWFVELQKKYGSRGLQIVGVSMDQWGKTPVRDFAGEFKVNYPLALGNADVANRYGGIRSLPTTFYIDRNGRVMDVVPGLMRRDGIEERIKAALATKPVASRAGAR